MPLQKKKGRVLYAYIFACLYFMGILLRIVLLGIIFGFFGVIVFVSFFTDSQKVSFPEIPVISDTQSEDISITGSGIFQTKVSLYENIYSTDNSLEITSQEKKETLKISSGNSYMFSLRDISKDYHLQGEGYIIDYEGIGEIFIDTKTSPGKVFLMSMTAPIHLSITNADYSEYYTDIYLTPHMYIEFQPVRGKFLKNADVVRVETVYKLGYFPGKITEIHYDEYLQKFSKDTLSFIYQSYNDLHEYLGKFSKDLSFFDDQIVFKLPGYDMIMRYTNLFVNDQKKKVFYKNKVLDGLIEMTQSQEYTSSLVSQVNKDLEKLHEIDPESYNELIRVINYLGFLVYSNYDSEYMVAKIYFAALKSGDFQKNELYFPLYGFSLFGLHDGGGEFSSGFLERYLKSFDMFYTEKQNGGIDSALRYQYFSFFLGEQLNFLLKDGLNIEGIQSEIETLKTLIDSVDISYSGESENRVTALYVYNETLKSLDEYMRSELFIPERTSGNLLQLHNSNKLSYEETTKLADQIDRISVFLHQSKIFLESTNARDITLKTDILLSLEKVQEYFSALVNYEGYSLNYDTSKQNIYNEDIFLNNEKIEVSLENAGEYLSQFTGISGQGFSLEVVDDYYYQVRDVFIAGKNFSFDIYPLTSYRMQNIIIDGEPISFVYKLENIESQWREKYEVASNDEKEKYDFSRFFLITFFNENDKEVEKYIAGEIKLGEDKTEIVFKRDILLGEKGEFKDLGDIVTIKYDDIHLEKINDIYDIFLEDIDFHVPIQSPNEKKQQKGIMNSRYVLSKESHFFKDIRLKVFLNAEKSLVDFEFGGNELSIIGKVDISDIHGVLEDILMYVREYSSVYNTIVSNTSNTGITMNYTLYNKKMSFKFDSLGKSYNILLSGNEVTGIYIGVKNMISQNIPINEISQYIK